MVKTPIHNSTKRDKAKHEVPNRGHFDPLHEGHFLLFACGVFSGLCELRFAVAQVGLVMLFVVAHIEYLSFVSLALYRSVA